MATYHVRMSIGNGGKAVAHFKYIERTGKYRRNDKLYSETGNLPSWAASPRDFWERTGLHDKRSYREIEFALPNELSREEQKKIVDDFIKDYLPDKAYTYAIHEPRARLSDEKNPHVHIMFSERIIDDRTKNMQESDFFKRYGISRTGSIYGGSIKDRKWAGKGNNTELLNLREDIANRINAAYERNKIASRVSAKSLEEQKREHYRVGDIEGGILYKRAKPFRAPTELFIPHAGEIAAAGRGEIDPNTITNLAARLRAYQEQEKAIVKEIVAVIAARNAALEPTQQEQYFGTAHAVEKLEVIVSSFGDSYKNTEICHLYEQELRRLQALLASQKEAMENLPNTENAEIREFSVNKAEGRLLSSSPVLPDKASAEETMRALFSTYLSIRDKEKEKTGQTVQAFLEKETDRRAGGRIAALNREIEKLSYTFRPKAEKEEKRKTLEQQKRELIRSTLSPADFEKAEQLHKEAEKERWKYISITELLEEQMKQVIHHFGMTEKTVEDLFRVVAKERIQARKEEETRSLEPQENAAPASITAKEPQGAEPKPEKKTETPDMRMLQRAIGDAERSIARAEKKIAELHSRTEMERLEAHIDQITGGRITELAKAREEEIQRLGHSSPYIDREYEEKKQLIMRAKATPEVRKTVRREIEQDDRRSRGLAKYIRSLQKDIMQRRAALSRFQMERNRMEKQARLDMLRQMTTNDFLRHAVNEISSGGLARLEKQRQTLRDDPASSVRAIQAAEEACRIFYQTHLTPDVRNRANQLAEAHQKEQQDLTASIDQLSRKIDLREPFVSRYRKERSKILANAARRRAFLYEEKLLSLSRNPNSIRYYCDEIINEKTEGLLGLHRDQYLSVDKEIHRIEEEKDLIKKDAGQTLAIWKEVWAKPPLRPMKGSGRPVNLDALKKERQTAEAAVQLLRKDYNVPEIWKEAANRLSLKKLDQQRRQDAIRILRARIEKDRKRKYLTAQARAMLTRAARLADKLLGGESRGASLGANIRIGSAGKDNDIQGY